MNDMRNSDVGMGSRVNSKTAAADLMLAEMEAMSDYKHDNDKVRNSQFNIGTRGIKKNPTTDRSDAASNSAGSNLSSVGEMLNLQNYFHLQGKTKNIQGMKNQAY